MASVVVACVALDDAGVDDDGVTTDALCVVAFVDGDAAAVDAADVGELADAGSDAVGTGEFADVVTGGDALVVDEAATEFAVEGVAEDDCDGVSEPLDVIPLAPVATGLGNAVGAPEEDARGTFDASLAEVRDVVSPECCRVYS